MTLFFRSSYESNIPKFFLLSGLFSFMLFLPIWVIFIQEKHGLALTQLTLVDSAFWLSMALTEVPTGAVADSVGRKQSMVIGIALSLVGTLLFAFAPTYPLLLIANSMWAISLTFISGADLALFYDSLRQQGRENEYSRLRGIAAAIEVGSIGLSGVIGGYLAEWWFESPFIFYAAILLPTFLIALSLKEPPKYGEGEDEEILSYRQILKGAYAAIRQRPNLAYILGYASLLPLVSLLIGVTLIQPYAIGLGYPIASLGVIVLGLNLVRIVGSTNADRITKRLGENLHLALSPVLVVAGIVVMGFLNNGAGLAFFGVSYFASSTTRPLTETIMLREAPGSVRATIMSIDSLILRLLLAIMSPLAGAIGDASSLSTAFIVLALGTGLVIAILLWRWNRVR